MCRVCHATWLQELRDRVLAANNCLTDLEAQIKQVAGSEQFEELAGLVAQRAQFQKELSAAETELAAQAESISDGGADGNGTAEAPSTDARPVTTLDLDRTCSNNRSALMYAALSPDQVQNNCMNPMRWMLYLGG